MYPYNQAAAVAGGGAAAAAPTAAQAFAGQPARYSALDQRIAMMAYARTMGLPDSSVSLAQVEAAPAGVRGFLESQVGKQLRAATVAAAAATSAAAVAAVAGGGGAGRLPQTDGPDDGAGAAELDPDEESLGGFESEDEEAEDDIDNYIICQCDKNKIKRKTDKYKVLVRDGIMQLNGTEYMFNKLEGGFVWMG